MDKLVVYYDSRTGNVQRFVNKLKETLGDSLETIRVGEHEGYSDLKKGHLLSFTTKIGQIPDKTNEFLKTNSHLIETITVSGNTNWGKNFGLCLDKIVDTYPNIKSGFKFELSGTKEDVNKYIKEILNFKNEYN